jgi:hypothetical protein
MAFRIILQFIQRPLISREKQHRPTETDWQDGWHTFYKVIEILKPDYILFCGVEAINREFANWNAIKKTEYRYTNRMTKTKNRIGRTFIRSKGSIQKIDTQLIISCIDHPSSRFHGINGIGYSMNECRIILHG